jgi:hypothetical protein
MHAADTSPPAAQEQGRRARGTPCLPFHRYGAAQADLTGGLDDASQFQTELRSTTACCVRWRRRRASWSTWPRSCRRAEGESDYHVSVFLDRFRELFKRCIQCAASSMSLAMQEPSPHFEFVFMSPPLEFLDILELRIMDAHVQ